MKDLHADVQWLLSLAKALEGLELWDPETDRRSGRNSYVRLSHTFALTVARRLREIAERIAAKT